MKQRLQHQNLTLSLPVKVLRKFRVYAAERNQSMSSLVTQAMEQMVDKSDEHDRAGRELIEYFRNAKDRGTGGKITWTREQLYEEMLNEKSK